MATSLDFNASLLVIDITIANSVRSDISGNVNCHKILRDGPHLGEYVLGARVPTFAQLVDTVSEFMNKRGIYLGRRSAAIHVALYRRTNGRIGGHVPGRPNARILLLEHVGARSGVRRTTPLIFHEEPRSVAVVASKGGQPTHPAWFHNLMANPDTSIRIGSAIRNVHARVATSEERERLWPRFVAFYPGYEFFARNAGSRKIPIVILDPR